MVFAIAGLIVIVLLIAVFSNRPSRQCRWREDRRRGSGAREKAYVCATCGAHAVTSNGKPPYDCRRSGANRSQ